MTQDNITQAERIGGELAGEEKPSRATMIVGTCMHASPTFIGKRPFGWKKMSCQGSIRRFAQ